MNSNVRMGSIPILGTINLTFNQMKQKIKETITVAINNVLKGIGDQLKGDIKDSKEIIIDRNINIAMLSIDKNLNTFFAKISATLEQENNLDKNDIYSILKEISEDE